MRTSRFLGGALSGVLLCATLAAHAQTAYRVGAMAPNISLYAINNAGTMVGETYFGQEGALVFANGVVTNITGTGPGAGAAYGINNAGTVVGTAAMGGDVPRAFVYRNGNLSPLSSRRSEAYDINARGQIVGWDIDPSGIRRAFLYERGTLGYLNGVPNATTSWAHAINNRGQIVGDVETEGGPDGPDLTHAFLYERGAMRQLEVNAYLSWARDINDAGQIVGGAVRGSDTFAYLYDGGSVTEIGTFGGNRSYAEGINNLGQVVGMADAPNGVTHGFLFDDGVLSDLSVLTPGWRINAAYDINDRGQIAAIGCRADDAGACFALRLDPVTPVPEPDRFAMLGLGTLLTCALARRRRRGAR